MRWFPAAGSTGHRASRHLFFFSFFSFLFRRSLVQRFWPNFFFLQRKLQVTSLKESSSVARNALIDDDGDLSREGLLEESFYFLSIKSAPLAVCTDS